MKKSLLRLAFFLCVITIVSSCKKDKKDELQFGTVVGIVHAAKENKTVNHALVYIDYDNAHYSTYSDQNGTFSLQAPAGTQTLHIQTGNGKLFASTEQITITANQIMSLSSSQTELRLTQDLAFIAGAYDNIEALVQDSLGYPITQITDNDLLDPAILSTYGAIFMNCNQTTLLPAPAYSNLSDFVNNGGSLYVSDFAMGYLVGDWDGGCMPLGGFVDDSLLCATRTGPQTLLPNCSIVDTAFQSYIGTSTMNIEYDLSGWEVVQLYSQNYWDVIVSDPTFGPLMLRHKLSNSNIYFTTFHNEPNGSIGPDMLNMLEYVILNL